MPLYKGTNLEDALENASIEENVDVKYLTYFVESQTEEETVINVYYISEIISFAQKYISDILINFDIEIKTKSRYEDQLITIAIDTDNVSLLIGKNGNTLSAITDLVRAAVHHKFGRHFRLLVDVDSYKNRKYDKFIAMAKKVANEVLETKVAVTLDPMTSDERRAIHHALSEFSNIRTESKGLGKNRSLTISYIERTK